VVGVPQTPVVPHAAVDAVLQDELTDAVVIRVGVPDRARCARLGHDRADSIERGKPTDCTPCGSAPVSTWLTLLPGTTPPAIGTGAITRFTGHDTDAFDELDRCLWTAELADNMTGGWRGGTVRLPPHSVGALPLRSLQPSTEAVEVGLPEEGARLRCTTHAALRGTGANGYGTSTELVQGGTYALGSA